MADPRDGDSLVEKFEVSISIEEKMKNSVERERKEKMAEIVKAEVAGVLIRDAKASKAERRAPHSESARRSVVPEEKIYSEPSRDSPGTTPQAPQPPVHRNRHNDKIAAYPMPTLSKNRTSDIVISQTQLHQERLNQQTLEQDLRHKKAQIDSLMSELHEARELLKQAMLMDLQGEVDKQKRVIANLKEELEDCSKDREDLQDKIRRGDDRIFELEKLVDSLTRSNDQLKYRGDDGDEPAAEGSERDGRPAETKIESSGSTTVAIGDKKRAGKKTPMIGRPKGGWIAQLIT